MNGCFCDFIIGTQSCCSNRFAQGLWGYSCDVPLAEPKVSWFEICGANNTFFEMFLKSKRTDLFAVGFGENISGCKFKKENALTGNCRKRSSIIETTPVFCIIVLVLKMPHSSKAIFSEVQEMTANLSDSVHPAKRMKS